MATERTCIDIYCGAGGASFGAHLAGLAVRYGLDRDRFACATFARNHRTAYTDCRDVAAVTATEIMSLAGIDRVDFLLSGPNCQAVSTMGLHYDGDPRNLLFVHLARLIDEFRAMAKAPRNVIVENVPGIAFEKNVRFVRELVRFFIDRGYRCAADVVNFAAWGLPQLRHRFVLLATLEDVELSLPAPIATVETGEGVITAWDAISDLSDVVPTAVNEPAQRIVPKPQLTRYQKTMVGRANTIFNHHVGRTAEVDLRRISSVPQGGCWKDIPPDLMPERFRRVRMTDYKTLFGRIHEDHPAYTLSASFANVTSGCFTHPRHDRPLTIREGCRIQGFPDSFEVQGPVPSQYRQIGNAVPALGAQRLVAHWLTILNGRRTDGVQPRLDAELLFGSSSRKFPILTPRYQRIGYGSGTYWPKGWGPEPKSRPDSTNDYRISKDPIRFRRPGWRKNRELHAVNYLDSMTSVRWQPTLKALPAKGQSGVLIFTSASAAASTAADAQLARDHFMDFLAPVAAAVAALVRTRGSLTVVCDFGLTTDWLERLLRLLARRHPSPFTIVKDAEIETNRQRTNVVRLVSATRRVTLDGGLAVIVAPFGDALNSLGLAVRNRTQIPSPSTRVRVTHAERIVPSTRGQSRGIRRAAATGKRVVASTLRHRRLV